MKIFLWFDLVGGLFTVGFLMASMPGELGPGEVAFAFAAGLLIWPFMLGTAAGYWFSMTRDFMRMFSV